MRYKSVGGCFILAANKEIMQGQAARCNILAFQSSQTKRVCRSTLAAEASHLAEAVEAGDWICILLEEALKGNLDLRNWQETIYRRQQVYVTGAKSVYDYLQRDATSTSTDKRMALEGALLRETVRQPNASVRWIDGMQNFADVLTKANASKDILKSFLRDGLLSFVQTDENKQLKEQKREERSKRDARREVQDTTQKVAAAESRRAKRAAEVEAEAISLLRRKNECVTLLSAAQEPLFQCMSMLGG